MRLKIKGEKFYIRWSHFFPRKVVSSRVGPDESLLPGASVTLKQPSGKEIKRPGTVCLVGTDRGTAEGVAVVHPRDKFDIEKGRKISLTKALAQTGLGKSSRKQIWDAYFGRLAAAHRK